MPRPGLSQTSMKPFLTTIRQAIHDVIPPLGLALGVLERNIVLRQRRTHETESNKRKAGRMTTEGFADDGTMLKDFALFNLTQEMDSEQKKPWPMGRFARTLFKTADFRMVLISMEKGSILKEHHADGTISVQVLKGSIRFTAKGEAHTLQPNTVVTLGASIKHEVEALEESAFLLTIAWPAAEKLRTMKHRGYGS